MVDHLGTIGSRLREAREILGLSQEDFAAIASQSRKSQMRYEADERSPDGPYFASIAARGVDIQYVLTGQTAADRLARQTADALHSADDFASIPVHDAFLAAGHSAENNAEAIIGHLAFRREWLSRVGVSAEKARIARVRGDSMQPTLHHSDLVLLDGIEVFPPVQKRGHDDRRRSPIYAFRDGGDARIKRIERPSEDQLLLLSDNPDYAPELRTGCDLAELKIIGKVVWWGHTVKE